MSMAPTKGTARAFAADGTCVSLPICRLPDHTHGCAPAEDASCNEGLVVTGSPAFERVKESMFSSRTARGTPLHADEFRSNRTRRTCTYACLRPLDGLTGGASVASGRLRPQAVRSHQIIGERMQQCNRLAFDQSANRHEAEAMVLAVSVEPLDQLAELVNGLTRLIRHPTAPFLDAVGFAPPFAFSVPQRCGAYVGIGALGRQRRIDLHGSGFMCRQGGDILGGGVMGIDQERLRSLAVTAR